MWFFKKKAAPYNLSTQLFKEDYPIHYSLYDGVRVSDQKEFSIFEIKADQSPIQQALAQNAIKIWKTFRHPAIPLFIESYEYDGATYIVTNKLLPFDDRNLTDSELTWAIYVMADFVNFLSEDAKAIHGNIQDSALYMTYGHELKIAGLHWMTVNGSGPISDFYQEWSSMCKLANPKPPINSPPYSIDVRFIGDYLKRWESRLSRAITKFSSRWTPTFKNPPSPQTFLSMEFWQTDKFIVTLTSLRDLPLKDQFDRETFFKSLVETLNIFSVETQEYTILPILLSSLSFSQTPAVLESISAIGSNIKPESFGAKIAPALLPLFESKDRNIRVHLLSQISNLIHHFSDKVINETIFKNVVQGFNDSVAALKAATIVSMVSIAPHLNGSNIKTLLRELERLQGDQDPSIRCNSVICIAKIAEYIQPEFRTATLISCFSRATKDTFAQSRKAAVSAYKTCNDYFNEVSIAVNIMPTLAPLCVDQSIEVRCLALKQMREYIEFLSKDVVFDEQEPDQSKPVSKPQKTTSTQNASQKASNNDISNDDDGWGSPIEVKKKEPLRPKTNPIVRNSRINNSSTKNSVASNDNNNNFGDEDDDGWGNPIEIKKKDPIRQKNTSPIRNSRNTSSTSINNDSNANVDDDDWGNAISVNVKNNTRTQKPNMKTSSLPPPKSKVASNTQSPKKEDINDGDGWDDLDDDDFENAINVGINKNTKQQQQLNQQLHINQQNSKNSFTNNEDENSDDDWGEAKVVPVKSSSNNRSSAPIKQVRSSANSPSSIISSSPEIKNEPVKPAARPVERKPHQPVRGKKIIIQKVDQGWDDDIDWD